MATAPASGHLLMTVVNLPLFFIDGTAQAHIPLALFLLSVVAALLMHTAVNFWPSVVPVLPTEASHRAYAFVIAMLGLLALLALALTSERLLCRRQSRATNDN